MERVAVGGRGSFVPAPHADDPAQALISAARTPRGTWLDDVVVAVVRLPSNAQVDDQPVSAHHGDIVTFSATTMCMVMSMRKRRATMPIAA